MAEKLLSPGNAKALQGCDNPRSRMGGKGEQVASFHTEGREGEAKAARFSS
jgi:hypothetical protein